MLNIIQVTPFYPPGFAFGGPTVTAAAVASGLKQLGHQVTTITSNRNGDGFSQVPPLLSESDGSKAIFCQTHTGRFLYAPSLCSTLSSLLPAADLVLVPAGSWNYFFFSGCRMARRLNKPYVVYPHGNFSPWALSIKKWRKKFWWALFDRQNYQRAASVVALTRDEADQIKNMGITSRIEIIPNGINFSDYQTALSREEIEDQFPKLKNKRWLLFMARLHPIKGLDSLLPALAETLKLFPDLQLIIAGSEEGSYGLAVKRMISDLNVDEAVCLTGMVTGPLKNGLLRHAELFLLPSYSEGLPMGVLEAMACGLPVVITPNCHLPEVGEYNAGMIVETDTKEVSQAIITLLQNCELRLQMGHNAKQLVGERFTWKRVAETTSELLCEMVSKSSK